MKPLEVPLEMPLAGPCVAENISNICLKNDCTHLNRWLDRLYAYRKCLN